MLQAGRQVRGCRGLHLLNTPPCPELTSSHHRQGGHQEGGHPGLQCQGAHLPITQVRNSESSGQRACVSLSGGHMLEP